MNDPVKVTDQKYIELKEVALRKTGILSQSTRILVGTATCGRAAGAAGVLNTFREEISKRQVDAEVIEVGCLGHCYAEPMVIIAKAGHPSLCYGNVDEGIAARLVSDFLVDDDPCYEFAMAALEPNDFFPTFADYPRGVYEQKIILRDCGLINPEDIDQYIALDGYGGLAKALNTGPAAVINEIKASKMRGRGGAGFPTGKK